MNFDYSAKASILVVLVAFAALMLFYYTQGPLWDVIVHYLNARSFMQQQFITGNFVINQGIATQQDFFYIEIYREALPNVLLIPLILIFGNPILEYFIALFAIYVVSLLFLSKCLKMDKLLLLAIMLNPYFLSMSFIINGTEILSLSMILIMLGFVLRKSSWAGVFFGLSILAKYPTAIFFPMLFFLKEPKKIALSFALTAIVMLPWLSINSVYFGGPFASIIDSIQQNILTPGVSFSLASFFGLILMALVFSAALAAILFFKDRKSLGKAMETVKSSFRKDGRALVIASFIVLAFAGYLIVAVKHSEFDQLRYGYIFAASLLLPVGIAMQEKSGRIKMIKWAIPALSIILISAFVFLYYLPSNSPSHTELWNANLNSSVVVSARNELANLGYANCRVVSNSWIYLLYAGVDAYNPFFPNATVDEYPIVVLPDWYGVNSTFITNLNSSKVVYNSTYYSIRVPENVSCFR